MTWRQYGEDLERKLADLHARIHRGAYPKITTLAELGAPDKLHNKYLTVTASRWRCSTTTLACVPNGTSSSAARLRVEIIDRYVSPLLGTPREKLSICALTVVRRLAGNPGIAPARAGAPIAST
jgi:hypothetical protein